MEFKSKTLVIPQDTAEGSNSNFRFVVVKRVELNSHYEVA